VSPLLELRTTISPTPYFFRRIHFMAASLRALGGELADHELVVSVGGEAPRQNLYVTQSWSNLYPITWRWVDPKAYARLGYRATNRDRAAHMARCRYVMMVDADVIFCRDFSELLDELGGAPAIAGVMAHGSPFSIPPTMAEAYVNRVPPGAPDSVYWDLLAEGFGVDPLPQTHIYSGSDAMFVEMGQRGPAYFNGGMVLGPRPLMDQLCELYESAEDAVDQVMTTYFRPQLARTLAIRKAGVPYRLLPLRYNYPNDPGFDAKYPDELLQVVILHYLRNDILHRDEDFMNADRTARLVGRADLSGSNEVLRRRIAELHLVVAEEEASAFGSDKVRSGCMHPSA
jgi:hypothetical protein